MPENIRVFVSQLESTRPKVHAIIFDLVMEDVIANLVAYNI